MSQNIKDMYVSADSNVDEVSSPEGDLDTFSVDQTSSDPGDKNVPED